MISLFLKGILIGLAVAAPVGPISLLTIQRTLNNGFKIGVMTALGAATADGVYGVIAAFGLTAVSGFLVSEQFWIRLIGALFLFYLGCKILFKPAQQQATLIHTEINFFSAYSSTFILTLTNPMTVISYIAIFAGLGMGSVQVGYVEATLMVIGIMLGSLMWDVSLSACTAFVLRRLVSPTFMKVINYISGVIIILFGFFALKI